MKPKYDKATAVAEAQERTDQLRRTATEFAQSILDDHSGDAAYAKACDLANLPHPYSYGNLFLISMQAKDSALVCAKGAYDKMAQKQGHEGVTFKGNGGKSWKQHVRTAKGSHAVYILAPRSWSKTETDAEGNETKVAAGTYFRSVGVYRAEDIVYCDTQTPFVVPTISDTVDTADAQGLLDSLTGFAGAKGIVIHRSATMRLGLEGVSFGGHVQVRGGNVAEVILPLIHELAHELLHPLEERGSKTELAKKFREAEAEAVAATCLRALGYETPLSAAYLRNYQVKPEDVKQSLTRIVGAARELLTWLREGRLPEGEEVTDQDASQDAQDAPGGDAAEDVTDGPAEARAAA